MKSSPSAASLTSDPDSEAATEPESGLARRILTAMLTVGALTILIKVLGLFKELVVASRFGSSDTMDAFVSAFAIWTFLTGLIGGAMPDALLPVYSRAKQRGKLAADRIATDAVWIYGFKLLLGAGAFVLLVSWLTPVFTYNYSEEKRAMTVRLFQWLTPFAIFWAMSMLMTVLLQANKRFFLAAAAPAAIPICAVAGLLGGYERFGIYSLVLGTTVGAAIQLTLVTAGFFARHCSLRRPRLRGFWSEDMRALLRATWPYLLSGALMGGTILVDVGMAAGLDRGSVSVLAYAERLCTIGLALAAAIITETLYPYLADMVAGNQWRLLKRTVARFAALIVAVSIPAIVLIWIGAEWLVAVLFERREFTPEDTARVASVLRWLSLQIPFNLLAMLGSRVVCAMLAARFMLLTTVVNLGLNIAGNYVFAKFMGVEGIALSTSVVFLVSAIMLYAYFFRQLRLKSRSQ